MRFAISPAFELVSSLRLFRDPASAALHLPWLEDVRGQISDAELLPLLSLLPPKGYVPDFITPPPSSPLMRMDAEFERILATPPRQIRKELDIFERQHADAPFPTAAEPLRRRPAQQLPKLVAAIRAYWQRALEPHWPRVLALLSADLHHRATRLTEAGPQALFEDLHPMVSFEGEWLNVDHGWEGTVELAGDGLLLVPSAFNWQKPSVISIEPWQPTLIYPARGTALLWETRGAASNLAALIGVTRARILQALDAPRSTSELAAQLDITA